MQHRFSGLRPDVESVVQFTSADSTLALAAISGCRWLVGKDPVREELKGNTTFDFAGFADTVAAATEEAHCEVDAAQLGTLLIMSTLCQADAGEPQDENVTALVREALAYLSVEPPEAAAPGLFDINLEQLTPEDTAGLLRVFICVKAARGEGGVWQI